MKHEDFVDAFLDANHAKMRRIVEKTPESDPVHIHLKAILVCTEAVAGIRSSTENPTSLVRTALDNPPKEVELYLLLLRTASYLALHANRIKEAQRLFRALKQLEPQIKNNPRLIALILTAEGRISRAVGDYAKQLQLYNKVFDLEIPPGSKTWILLKINHFQCAIENEALELANRDLTDLKAFQEHIGRGGILSYDWLKAYYLYSCGKIRESIEILDISPPDDIKDNRKFYLQLRIQLLIKIGRFHEAEELLQKERSGLLNTSASSLSRSSLDQSTFENLSALLCLARRDLEGAAQHAREAMGTAHGIHPVRAQWSHLLITWCELAAGHSMIARRILLMLDRNETRSELAMEWARLHLLEGDEDRALEHFDIVKNKGIPELLEDKLRYAYELSPGKVASLLTRGGSSKSDRVRTQVTPQPREASDNSPRLIGETPAIREVRDRIETFAPLELPVLISGETGTGKDVVARMLHDRSGRADKPFIPVNCAALSDTLIESELFGHVKGAFTGATRDNEGLFVAAGGGTLFLDEITSMSPRLQAALLRVLENREVCAIGSSKIRKIQARVIAAANQPLAEEVEKKNFRADLYFRLARLHIEIPPLRERADDIPLLTEYFLREVAGTDEMKVGEELKRDLKAHTWPGNVRELKNQLEFLSVMSGDTNQISSPEFHRRVAEEREQPKPSDSDNKTDEQVPLPPKDETEEKGEREPEPVSPKQEASSGDGKPYRHTFRRRKKIIELFEEHEKMTRAEIIDILGCSPNTATRDLKSLMEEGVIHRVMTSAHLRTSYFELLPHDDRE